MFRILCIYFVLIAVNITDAQDEQRIWIYFKDKGNISSDELPLLARRNLSDRAIKRRMLKVPLQPFDIYDLPVSQEYIRLLSKLGITIHRKSKWLNAVSAYLNFQEREKIGKQAFVQKLEPVRRLRTYSDKISEASLPMTKASDAGYGRSYNQNQMLGIPYAHQLGYHGEGVRIAIFDTGFSLRHDALRHINVVKTWDFVNGDSLVFDEDDEFPQQDHGTEVLAVMAGYQPGQLIGPTYASEFLLAKTEDLRYQDSPVEEDNWVAAAEWADSLGVDIISSSVGYGAEVGYSYEDMDGNTTVVTKAANIAVQKGISVFAAAGNEGTESWYYITAPADGQGVLAIGGVTTNETLWLPSSHGPTYDGRIKPDLMAQATSVYTISLDSLDTYKFGRGTSFACPLAAGVGAILLSIDPSLTPAELNNKLKLTSSYNENPNNDFGWGIIDLESLLYIMQSEPYIQISLFTGQSLAGKNELRWNSRFEIENEMWIIKRKNNTGSYQEIGRLDGQTYSLKSRAYSFIDIHISGCDTLHYQLATRFTTGDQIDLDSLTIVSVPAQMLKLYQNYPNPFNSQTTITLSLVNNEIISLKIFDINGRRVKTLVNNEEKEAGFYNFVWDGKNNHGSLTASGTYYVLLQTEDTVRAIKLLQLR
jgi:hypothetical protein